ncbi:unnamed protein product [Urochloa decumbens]|uniref:Phospholipase A1 EG1, chloroplastic/mitochondrial n=1 Tax=Urochloa decumbens TaxID=240449 RepID=A0ABC9AYS2_9POAL
MAAAAAAAAKLAVAPAAPTTTTSRHRACTAIAVSSAATPVTVSISSATHKQEAPIITSAAATAVVAKKQAAAVAPPSPTTDTTGRSEAAATLITPALPPLASMWREVHGAGDWRGLVAPLHPVLRGEIVRYGELVAACYRAFDLDPRSKRYLNCKHGKAQMLRAVGLEDAAGYEVTKYIYAAPDVALPVLGGAGGKSRWIGYVAVATDGEAERLGRRDILVSFRGTVTGSEWLANFMSALAPARFDPADPRPGVRVESGFLSLYTSDDAGGRFTAGSCRNQLLSEVTRLIGKYKHEELSITLAGHSMGSSLAVLLGYDLAELGLNSYPASSTNGGGGAREIIPVTVFSFAGPRVGNLEFRDRCDELGVKVLRVANVNDPVTKMPGVVLNEGAARVLAGRYEMPWSKACYAHVGVEVALDFFQAGDIACVHDLEAYIEHLLKCGTDDDDDTTVSVTSDSIIVKEEEAGVRRRLASMFQSWRWQMAAIRAGELLMQALGI